jgi:flagellar biosynthesis protein FlhB
MSSSEEKTEEASDHRLRNARKEGDVAVSHHLTDGLVFAAVCIAIWLAADLGFRQLDTIFSAAMDAVPNKLHAGEELSSAANAMIIAALYIVAPLLLLAALVSLVVSVTQTRGMFSTEPMKFKFDRLNPSETIKNLFSTRQLGVLIQMVLAVGLIGGIVLSTLNSFIELMIFDIYGTERFIGGSVAKALMYLFFLAAGVYVALGLLDYAQAYFEFLKRNRMSKSDRKREHKENDGGPQLRTPRALARNRRDIAKIRCRRSECRDCQSNTFYRGALLRDRQDRSAHCCSQRQRSNGTQDASRSYSPVCAHHRKPAISTFVIPKCRVGGVHR